MSWVIEQVREGDNDCWHGSSRVWLVLGCLTVGFRVSGKHWEGEQEAIQML